MYQESKDKSTAFQTQVTGGKAYIGNHYHSSEPFTPVKHIPYTGAKHFVGRNEELATIHEKLHTSNTLVISAVAGMGGVGKTELAIKYAREHENDYPGGICWFSVRESDIATSLLTFANNDLKLKVPSKDFQEQPLTLKQQVEWCWRNWRPPEGLVLVVLDDVTGIDNIAEYLPKDNRFRVLITTRLRNLDINTEEILLDVLSSDEALQLLRNIIGEARVNKELKTAKKLCEWLGYLPLGIELVGRYIKAQKLPSFTLARMLEQLEEQRLQQEALNPKHKTLSTAERGVSAAFELSWSELDDTTRQVAALLSLFASEIFAIEWVESTIKNLNWNVNDAEIAVGELYGRHLVQCLEYENTHCYKIHPLIREFLQEKLKASKEINKLKQGFVSTFIEISRSIPNCPTFDLINSLKNAIPHLIEVAKNLIDIVCNDNLVWAFVCLDRLYSGQGLYAIAETWSQRCVLVLQSRLGDNHPDYAISLDNLASLYCSQGKYDNAEPLLIQAMELKKRILGDNHPYYTGSLVNLANLYYSQGKYDQSKTLFIQVLELTKRILGDNHPDYVAGLDSLANIYYSQGKYKEAKLLLIEIFELTKHILEDNYPGYAGSLNNLANIYCSQGKYDEAEPLYIQALELTKRILGDNHPDYVASLNNLAFLYNSQRKYDEAETKLIQALELTKRILGDNHPKYALSLNNLARFYHFQGKYDKAKPLYIQALDLTKYIFGENHPDYAGSLDNLASFYYSQRKYDEAEPLYIQALDFTKRVLGENHPEYAICLNNLANLYSSQRKYNEAKTKLIQALKIAELSLGANHQTIIIIRKNLKFAQSKIIFNTNLKSFLVRYRRPHVQE